MDLSNLSKGQLHHAPHLFHVDLEGVLIGVMLDDVVIHVYQDPVKVIHKACFNFFAARLWFNFQKRSMLLTLFCTFCRPSPFYQEEPHTFLKSEKKESKLNSLFTNKGTLLFQYTPMFLKGYKHLRPP